MHALTYDIRLNLFLILQVHGVIRRSSSFNTGRIKHLFENPALHRGGGMVLDTCTGRALTRVLTVAAIRSLYFLRSDYSYVARVLKLTASV